MEVPPSRGSGHSGQPWAGGEAEGAWLRAARPTREMPWEVPGIVWTAVCVGPDENQSHAMISWGSRCAWRLHNPTCVLWRSTEVGACVADSSAGSRVTTSEREGRCEEKEISV